MQNPSHPGEVLGELYLKSLGLSALALARRIGVPRTRIERLVKGETGVSTDTALRLARFLNTTPEFWLHLQRAHDLDRARREIDVSHITPLEPA